MMLSLFHKLYDLFNKIASTCFPRRRGSNFKLPHFTDINFVCDKYIYKNIEKGYFILYHECNLNNNNFDFNNLKIKRQVGPDSLKKLHSFHWLQDLKPIKSQMSNTMIHRLIDSWIDSYPPEYPKELLDYEIWAARIFNWLTSPDIIRSSKPEFNTKFLENLSLQIQFFIFRCNVKQHKKSLAINKTFFTIGKAIGASKLVKNALDNIVTFLKANVLADGGILGCAPSDVLAALEHVIFVFRNLSEEDGKHKNDLRLYIDKLIIFIKSIRYRDGGLGIFNGGYEEDSDKINFLLSCGNVDAKSFDNLRYSGYLLLSSNNVIDVVLKTNTMLPKAAQNYVHNYDNSILSHEILVHGERIFVNNSINDSLVEKQLSRYLYSTLLFYDKNDKLINLPNKIGLQDCKQTNQADANWNMVTTIYKALEPNYGLIWYKTLSLAKHTSCLCGEDLVVLNNQSLINSIVLKFILHPSVVFKELYPNGNGLILAINKEDWIFKSTNPIKIDNEIYTGIRNEIFPTYSVNVVMSMKEKAIEWTLAPLDFIDKEVKPFIKHDNF